MHDISRLYIYVYIYTRTNKIFVHKVPRLIRYVGLGKYIIFLQSCIMFIFFCRLSLAAVSEFHILCPQSTYLPKPRHFNQSRNFIDKVFVCVCVCVYGIYAIHNIYKSPCGGRLEHPRHSTASRRRRRKVNMGPGSITRPTCHPCLAVSSHYAIRELVDGFPWNLIWTFHNWWRSQIYGLWFSTMGERNVADVRIYILERSGRDTGANTDTPCPR
jgi:hypothetical protein